MGKTVDQAPCPVTPQDVKVHNIRRPNFSSQVVADFSIHCPLKANCRYLDGGQVSGWTRGTQDQPEVIQGNVAQATNNACNFDATGKI